MNEKYLSHKNLFFLLNKTKKNKTISKRLLFIKKLKKAKKPKQNIIKFINHAKNRNIKS